MTQPKLFNVRRAFRGATLYLIGYSRQSNGYQWGALADAGAWDADTAANYASAARRDYGADCAVSDADGAIAVLGGRAPSAIAIADTAREIAARHWTGRALNRSAYHAELVAHYRTAPDQTKLAPKLQRIANRVADAFLNEHGAERISRSKSKRVAVGKPAGFKNKRPHYQGAV